MLHKTPVPTILLQMTTQIIRDKFFGVIYLQSLAYIYVFFLFFSDIVTKHLQPSISELRIEWFIWMPTYSDFRDSNASFWYMMWVLNVMMVFNIHPSLVSRTVALDPESSKMCSISLEVYSAPTLCLALPSSFFLAVWLSLCLCLSLYLPFSSYSSSACSSVVFVVFFFLQSLPGVRPLYDRHFYAWSYLCSCGC